VRAVQILTLQGPASVAVVDVPEPVPGPEHVLIDVAAAGVAHPELLQTRGGYQIAPPLPFIPGSELAGVVRAAPPGSGVAPGDRVAALCLDGGAWAEVAAVPAGQVFALPDSVELTAAGGFLFNDLTVHFALTERGRLRPGETVLVHGAAGGIGSSALRIALALQAGRVVAVVGSEAKRAAAKQAGATDVVLADGWLPAVVELLGPRAVDVIVDPVGGDRVTDSLRSLNDGGRLLIVGFTGGIPTIKANRLLLNNIEAVGVGWGAWSARHPGHLQRQWDDVRPLIDAGRLGVPAPRVYALDRAAEALAVLEARQVTGKLVLATGTRGRRDAALSPSLAHLLSRAHAADPCPAARRHAGAVGTRGRRRR
jgi:NADPH:quinone reductase